MRKVELTSQIKKLIRDLKPILEKECNKLTDSGAVDYTAYEKDDFVLAKAILHVALINTANVQVFPLSSEGKKNVKNLKHF